MKKYLILFGLLSLLAFGWKASDDRDAAVESAIKKSLPLLERGSHLFLKNAQALVNCHSCHNQGLGLVTFAMAKEKGYQVNDTIYAEAMDSTRHQWITNGDTRALMEDDDPVATLITGDYDLWGLAANHFAGDKLTDILARNIMHMQTADGSWFSPGKRPPMEYFSFSVTALAVKNMQVYLPGVLRPEVEQRVARARAWMTQTTPRANEERVFQLLGLTWCKGDTAFIAKQARKLLSEQRSDGGWAQLDSLPTDAYASGQALYALNQSGQLAVTDEAFQKGIGFLLRGQEKDGSWHVKTRSFPFVPFVDSGFPHEKDQFISAAGSNWATMALLLAAKNPEQEP
ncbi:hypothetical protein [Puia sp.]|uniref:hypothetical protein n=1 Tax=Puia sp. TaxID=2045100 RepID=UPI002F424B5D